MSQPSDKGNSDISLERTLPNNLEAERSVLGAILLDDKAMSIAQELLPKEDFYLEGHRRIFEAMRRLTASSRPIDLITLKEELQRTDELEAAGGAAYLASLTDGLPLAANVEHYVNIVKEKATLRRLIQISSDTMSRGYLDQDPPKEIVADVQTAITKIAGSIQRSHWQLADAAELETWPEEPLVWLVENLIPRGGIGFMNAAPKDRKSFLTLDLALHLAQPKGGRLWLDRWKCTPANILYIAREDPARRIKERALEICKSYNLPLPQPGRLKFLVRERISLTDVLHRDWLMRQIKDGGFDFLILDVLNRMIPNLDELSNKDMGTLVGLLEDLNRDLGITILCLDHNRKPQGKNTARDAQEPNPLELKGAIAKYGCADFMISLARTSQHGRMKVSIENKDDELQQFLLDVSPKGSTEPKFKFAGDVSQLADDMKAIGENNRNNILAALDDQWLTRKEVAQEVSLGDSATLNHLKKLFEAGKIEKKGKGNDLQYRKPCSHDEKSLWEQNN
jgi:DnaB-like helicase N terminal domain/AAA domain